MLTEVDEDGLQLHPGQPTADVTDTRHAP
jgi:hypothetical protein